jgi:hypothetical protein
MNCSSCGIQLPTGAKACPNCGTRTPAYYSNSGTSSYDPTYMSYPYGPQSGSSPSYDPTIATPPSSTPPQPSTGYGSTPYAPPFTPSGQPNPSTPLPPPPYGAQQTGPQPSYPPPLTPAGQQRQKPPRRFPTGITVLLIVLAMLLIGGSALIYYTTVSQPNLQHAQATATAVAHITGTAHAEATSTVQARATVQAQTNATATTQAQATAAVVATQTALQNIYTQATSGTPTINDPLSHADNFGWDEYPGNHGGGCAYSQGAYHSSATVGYFTSCIAQSTNFSNFAFQVEMTLVSGHNGGLMFRADSSKSAAYRFNISTDGTYYLDTFSQDNNGKVNEKILLSGSTSVINTGNNQSNLLAVVARGKDLYLYVNKQYVDSINDSTYQSGQIGMFTNSDTGGAEGVFRNAQVWKL